jgi:hypothetical protein
MIPNCVKDGTQELARTGCVAQLAMPEDGHIPLATQVGKQAQQRGDLRFGGGNPIQIAHEGYAHRICVVPLAMRPHALKGARCMHGAICGYHEVVWDIGVPTTLDAGSELLQRRVYACVMDDDLRYLAHGCSPVTGQ